MNCWSEASKESGDGWITIVRMRTAVRRIAQARISLSAMSDKYEHDVIAGAPAMGHEFEITGRLVAPR